MPLFVDLAFPLEVNKVFTYAVPPELHDAVKPGVRTVAPFGKRTAVGFVVTTAHSSSIPHIKSLQDIIDAEPVVSRDLLELTKWIAEYYMVSWGEVLKAAVPQGFTQSGKRIVKLTADNVEKAIEDVSATSPKQAEVLRSLAEKETMSIKQLQRKAKVKSIYTALHALAKQGYIAVTEQKPSSTPKVQSEKIIEIHDQAKAHWKEWRKGVGARRSLKQLDIIDTLLQIDNGAIASRQLLKQSKAPLSALKTLSEKGIVAVTERDKIRSPVYDLYDAALGAQNIHLSDHQQNVVGSILSAPG